MWKKVLLSLCLLIIAIGGIELFYFSKDNYKSENDNTLDIVNNETEISSQYVTDDCINEWSDYAIIVEEETQEASQILNDENRVYILRTQDDYINIYYINQDGEEILYKVTDIYVGYLGDEDVSKLKEGIQVTGIQNLNQLIEDFE